MKRWIFFLLLISLAPAGYSQTQVDDLVKSLETLSRMPLNVWRVNTEIKNGENEIQTYSDPEYDDSRWETLELNQSIYVDSCWLRKTFPLPKNIAGLPVKGILRFLISVDDYGYLWINGKEQGYFPWDGEFILTDNAQPGEKIVLLVKAVNTGGPLRLLQARVTSELYQKEQEKLEHLALSFKTGQKLLGFDTYQTNARVKVDPGIEKSRFTQVEKLALNRQLQDLASRIDVSALEKGRREIFWQSVEKVRSRLKPIQDYAGQFTLYFDANAHIDAAWLWRQKETVEVCYRTFSSVLHMMDVRPDFTYTQSQAVFYAWMAGLYPELDQGIQKRVREGRWELVGGMWVEPDCNLPDGVSWYRQLLYGQTYFQNHFGRKVSVGWNPDSFGYNWNLPQFFRNAGIDAFITQKIGWNDTSVFPYRVFWWEAPDGSRILSYFPFSYVDTVEDPFRLIDWLRQFEANTGFASLLILFGVGDHGGGPSLEMMERIDDLKELDIFPKIVYGTADTYLDWLQSLDLSHLPVWKDELYLEYHRGTFTTQAGTKKMNRQMEVLLTQAEQVSSVAGWLDNTFPVCDLEEEWKIVLFNQFHDILPGSSIREVYHDAEISYRQAEEVARFGLQKSLQSIAEKVHTTNHPRGEPLVVFNTLSWDRTDVVAVDLPKGEEASWGIVDLRGEDVPSQIVQMDKINRKLYFIAEDVPSVGYKLYLLRKYWHSPNETSLSISESGFDNEIFHISADPDSGWISSIRDKKNDREILKGYGNRLQLFEDRPTAWDAWNIGLGVEYPSRYRKIEWIERGPVRAVLRITRDFLKPGVTKSFPAEDFPSSFFLQDIILYAGIDRIDFKTRVEWWEDKTMLKVAFPVSVSDTIATFEIPYGTIQRSTTLKGSLNKGKWEVPALRWADISDRDYGVSLLNRSKYGYDIRGNVMRLTLLRSPEWPDPTADRGDHSIEYSLYPHKGDWKEAKTIQKGYEYNTPLLTVLTDRHKGSLPPVHSFISLSPSSLILTAVKSSEADNEIWIFQWIETQGEDTEATLVLPQKPSKVWQSDFLEEKGKSVKPEENKIILKTCKNSVQTIMVRF